jgi:signal transduction histidine kinase
MVELQQKIAQLGGGDLTVSVSFAHRNDEIGDLGRNFNQMVEQLRENRQEIERLHRTQMSRAEHMATLGEMATGLAHEIRNPLAGIAGVIEIIGRVMLGRQQALAKSNEISLRKDPSLPEVEHDSDQIHQLLLNLLLNALQAIDANGKIAVTVERRGTTAVIEVTDNGRGIAADHLPNIFRPFFTTKGEGTGLGLSLARRIVEDHQGRIDVTSTVGKGTTFAVVLPLERAAAPTSAS